MFIVQFDLLYRFAHCTCWCIVQFGLLYSLIYCTNLLIVHAGVLYSLVFVQFDFLCRFAHCSIWFIVQFDLLYSKNNLVLLYNMVYCTLCYFVQGWCIVRVGKLYSVVSCTFMFGDVMVMLLIWEQVLHVINYGNKSFMWSTMGTSPSCDHLWEQVSHVINYGNKSVMWSTMGTSQSCDQLWEQVSHVINYGNKSVMWSSIRVFVCCLLLVC